MTALLAEAGRTLAGSIAIARRDRDASRYFDLSTESFWRSFAAIVFVGPIYLFFAAGEVRMLADAGLPATSGAPSAGGIFLSVLVTLGIVWIAYPLVMFFLARMLGLANWFAPYVIVYNWSSIPVSLLLAAPFLLYALELIGKRGLYTITLLTFLAAFIYRWILARDVLHAGGLTALGIVVLEMPLSGIVAAVVDRAFFG